jgi:hypothetical protein
VQKLKLVTAVSKLAAENGRRSATPSSTVTGAAVRAAARRARAAIPGSGSSAVTVAPAGYQRSWLPVPAPTSSTRPRARAARWRRQAPRAARSNGHMSAS